jgi:uridine kinase
MMSSKETKGKKPLKESEANLKLPTAMTHANLKIQMGKPMLTLDTLKEGGKSCVVLHYYHINNYKKHQHIIGGVKEKHFLVVEGIFLISWSDLCNLYTLDALDISLMRCFTL